MIKNKKSSIFRVLNIAAIPASGIGSLQNAAIKTDTDSYGAFNQLILNNNSGRKIVVRLDGSANTERSIQMNVGEQLQIDPKDNLFFEFLTIENLDTVDTVAASTIDATFIRSVDNGLN